MRKLVIGTRKSKLALWQTERVKLLLEEAHPGIQIEIRHIVTKGDRTQAEGKPLPEIGGKGLFTAELEEALTELSIDLAVHSLKDLPTAMSEGYAVGAVCAREAPEDAFVSRDGSRLADLPHGATIGSSSVRRSAQLLRMRPDLSIKPIRGNVDTRLAKLMDPAQGYDGIVLALAGLKRLELDSRVTQVFAPSEMLPAPGQGAMAVQCRAGDQEVLSLLAPLEHARSRAETSAERAFLGSLNAGCNTPVACRATADGATLRFSGRCLSPDGDRAIEVAGEGPVTDPETLGKRLAREALERGFGDLYPRACGPQ